MKTAGALAILLLAALAVPTASAQGVPQGVTLTVTDLAAPIPYEGSAQLPVSVTVGCASILAESGTTSVTVDVTDPQAWLTVTPATFDISPPDCLTSMGSVSEEVTVGLAVTKDAPGVIDHPITLVATLGGTSSDPTPVIYTVAYHVNYTITADATFPLTVNGTEVSFNVTITQASNARSMVMIEEASTTAGTFAGVPAVVYENEAGKPATKTYKATFKAPTGEWTEATAKFTGYGHYLLLDGRAGVFGAANCAEEALTFPVCDETGTPVTYTFVAGAHHEHEEDEEAESPAPVGALLALGLVGLAAFVRRRS